MGVTHPSTKVLPVSLQLCCVSSSCTGLFPCAEWQMMVDLGIYSLPTPLQWVGNVSCMSAERSHPCGPAQRWLRQTSAFLSCIPHGEASGKQAHILHSSSCLDCLRWVLRTLLSQHGPWCPRAAGSNGEGRLQPAQLPPKLLRSLGSSEFLSHWRIMWVNWKGGTQKGWSI